MVVVYEHFYPGRLGIIQEMPGLHMIKLLENFPSIGQFSTYSTLGQMFKAKLFYQRFAFPTDFAGHDIYIHGF